jgi:methyl-accepting chemotaxis protein
MVYKNLQEEEWKALFKKMYEEVFRNNPQFYALWDSWELSHIDTAWKKPYGRYSYELYWDKNTIKQGSELMSLDGDPEMYARLKELNRQVIEEPYLYSFSGNKEDEVLMTSLIEPLQSNGRFIGVLGADMALDRFQELIAGIHPFEITHAYLLSNESVFVGHSNDEMLGKSLQEEWPELNQKFKIAEKIKDGDKLSFTGTTNGEEAYFSFTPIKIGQTITPWALGISVPLDLIQHQASKSFIIYILLGVLGLIIIGVAVVLQSRNITRPINKITSTLKKLANGEIDDSMKTSIKSGDEIEEMAYALNTSIDGLNQKTTFAQEIKEGNLKNEFKLLSDKDILGKSLLEMRDSLKHAKEEEEKRKKEDEKRRWANEGLAKFAEILRQHNEDLDKLGYSIIRNLIKYLEANQGGIFILNDEDKEEVRYDLLAAYAYNRRKYLEKSYYPGEGLVGTCAQEEKTMYLEELPQNYINITSGLGEANPTSLLMVPLKTEENVLGIIEIASFEKFEKHHIEFVEKVASSIASTLSSVKINIRTSELLEKSQQQAEEMSAQEEEMRQNMEELQATQEEAARRESELQGILEAMDKFLFKAEITLDGNIETANKLLLQLLGYEMHEIQGAPYQVVLPQEERETFEDIWEKLMKGETYQSMMKMKTKNDNEISLKSSFIPVKDKDKTIRKILYLAVQKDN